MIFFLILKIIGAVLLICLALLLIFILLVLFDPICYEVKAEAATPNISVYFKGHWLLYLFSFSGKYINNDFIFSYRILFKRHDIENSIDDDSTDDFIDNDLDSSDLTNDNPDSPDSIDDNSDSIDDNPEDNHIEKFDESDKSHKKEKSFSKDKKFSDNFKKIKNYYNKIKDFLSQEENKAALVHIKKELMYLIKIIFPKKIKVDADFSTGTPDTTALVLGFISMFPIGYENKWRISPDFESEELYVNGKADIKGKIFLFTLIGMAIRLLLDKNCKKLYNYIKN